MSRPCSAGLAGTLLSFMILLVASSSYPLDPTPPEGGKSLGRGNHGFIQAAPNGRYFQFQDGTPFFAVGLQDQYHMMESDLSRLDWERWFKLLRDSRVNVLRLMLDQSKDFWVEKSVDDCGEYPNCNLECSPMFNPAVEETLDYYFELAEKYSVYLQICPWSTLAIWMDFKWKRTYPYLSENGGPIEPPSTDLDVLFTNPGALCLEMRRLKWLSDRWGQNPYLFSWELMNEMNGYPDDPATITRWISIMANYMRTLDPDHLLTISTNNPWGDQDRNLRIWNHQDPYLDIVTFHGYGDCTADYYSEMWYGLPCWSEIKTIMYQILQHTALQEEVIPSTAPPARPVLNTEELGYLATPGNLAFSHDGEVWSAAKLSDHFRMSKWAHAVSGSAGTSVQNPASPSHGSGDQQNAQGFLGFRFEDYNSLKVLANLTAVINWTVFDPQPADGRILAPGFYPMAIANQDGSILLGWLLYQAEQTMPNPVTVTFSGLKNEAHQVVWYSDRTGKVLRWDSVSGPGATLSVPSSFFGDPDPDQGGQHLAVLVRPYRSNCNDINPDTDLDGIVDIQDNCPLIRNAAQSDADLDKAGDACDNCPSAFNRTQSDYDGDGVGDACEGACPLGADGTGTFYVDPYHGRNNYSGRSPAEAWRTIQWARNNVCEGSSIIVLTCGNGVLDGDEACDPPGSECSSSFCLAGLCNDNCSECVANLFPEMTCEGFDGPEQAETGPAAGLSRGLFSLFALVLLITLHILQLKARKRHR